MSDTERRKEHDVALAKRGRAITPEAKRDVSERILKAWLAMPDMRFGQFIENVVRFCAEAGAFYVEDAELARACEAFIARPKETP